MNIYDIWLMNDNWDVIRPILTPVMIEWWGTSTPHLQSTQGQHGGSEVC